MINVLSIVDKCVKSYETFETGKAIGQRSRISMSFHFFCYISSRPDVI